MYFGLVYTVSARSIQSTSGFPVPTDQVTNRTTLVVNQQDRCNAEMLVDIYLFSDTAAGERNWGRSDTINQQRGSFAYFVG